MNIIQLLTEAFNVSEVDLEKAKSYQQKYGGRLEKLLVNMGSLSEEDLLPLYQQLLDVDIVDIERIEELKELSQVLPESIDIKILYDEGWVAHQIEGILQCYTSDPLNWDVNQHLLASQLEFKLHLVNKEELSQYIQTQQGEHDESIDSDGLTLLEEDKLRELASEAPTVNLLNGLIAKGVTIGASDLHLEPVKGKYQIRYRVDGVLQESGLIPTALQLAIISRIKILGNMDIAEKRRPQDGKIETKAANVELDIRVSVLPLNDGESVVMRFLRKDAVQYDLETLGLSQDIERSILEDLKSTAGVILLTGPTGSGKTTSLYTFLNELNTEKVKIITLEDPVEYQLDGVNQVQVNSDIGFDFSAGLRSIVRQDPDIIMVGEIRDKETASIAMQSALTGHLVFSTVHTNDAPSAYTRLVDLGVEEFLLNAAIVSVMAQRLVRKICPHCSIEHPNKDKLIEVYSLEQYPGAITLKQAKGCPECSHSGYRGRMSIMEYLRCDESIRALSKDHYFIPEARRLNKVNGNRTLLEDGLFKACKGLTTIDEVLRVCA
jgi:general secretion pathway protein E